MLVGYFTPSNYGYLPTIKPSEIVVINQLSYLGGPTLYESLWVENHQPSYPVFFSTGYILLTIVVELLFRKCILMATKYQISSKIESESLGLVKMYAHVC